MREIHETEAPVCWQENREPPSGRYFGL